MNVGLQLVLLVFFLFSAPTSAAPVCLLPEPPPKGYDVTGCPAQPAQAPLQASQCAVSCNLPDWYIGAASVTCAAGNNTHPGQFEFSGCQRPACPLQCGAVADLVVGPGNSYLSALAFDRRRGFLYAADSSQHAVLSVDVRGVGAGSSALASEAMWGALGTPGDSDGAAYWARLRSPAGLVLDAERHILFASDSGNGKVRALFLASMSVATVIHSLNNPRAITLNSRSDELYVAEFGAGHVRRLNLGSSWPSSGASLESFGVFVRPVGLAADPARNSLYVAEDGSVKVVKEVSLITNNAQVVAGSGSTAAASFLAGVGRKAARFSELSALTMDLGAALGDGGLPTLFMADAGAKRVFAVELPRAYSDKGTSAKSCQELGWQAGMERFGSQRVCGRSWANRGDVEDLCHADGPPGLCCSGPGDWSRAKDFCEKQGARLCSAVELENDEAREGNVQPTCKTGSTDYDDYYDESLIWTSTACSAYRYGIADGYFVRAGARQWETHTPTQCMAANETAVYTKCCADGGLAMPIMGATAPHHSLGNGGHALYQTFASWGPSALALDALRQRLFVASGGIISVISWLTPQAVIAGAGYSGHTGEDIPAEYAALNMPLGLAWDGASAQLFVADSRNGAIRTVEAAGSMKIQAFAGRGDPVPLGKGDTGDGGDALEAYIIRPAGLAFDSRQRGVFVSTGEDRIRYVGMDDGIIRTVVNKEGSWGVRGDHDAGIDAELASPRGLALVGKWLFIADRDNHRVRLYYTDSGQIESAAGPVYIPTAISQSHTGLVVYSLATDPRVTSVVPPADVMRVSPVGLASTKRGTVMYIADEVSKSIVRMERQSNPRAVVPVLGSREALAAPRDLLLAESGTLFISDHKLHCIVAMEVDCSDGCRAINVRVVAGNQTERGDGELPRRRWTTTTTTTQPTTTTTTTTTTTELECLNYLLGDGGKDCHETCTSRRGVCDPTIADGFDYSWFVHVVKVNTGIDCERDSRTWWGDFLPAVQTDPTSRNYGRCLGTWGIPSQISCTGKQMVYGKNSTTLRQWCKCKREERCGIPTTTVTTSSLPSTTTTSGGTTTEGSPFKEGCPAGYTGSHQAIAPDTSNPVDANWQTTYQTSIEACAVACEVEQICAAFTYDGEYEICNLHGTGFQRVSRAPKPHEAVCMRPARSSVADLTQEVLLMDWIPAAGKLAEPGALVLDEERQLLYLSDSGNDKVKVLDLDRGKALTVAGLGPSDTHFAGDGGAARDATLWNPQGLALDESVGHLFIADTNNHVVRLVALASHRLTGVITTVAGDNVAGLYGDGGPALRARFRYPWGVTLGTAGTSTQLSILYIADASNNKIRQVDLVNDKVATLAGNDQAVASGDGGLALAAAVDTPHALISTTGLSANSRIEELLFTELPEQRIRQLTLREGSIDTAISTYAVNLSIGEGLVGIVPRDYDADVPFPYGVAAAADPGGAGGTLYTASYQHHRVRKTDLLSGLTTTLAGKRSQRGSGGDGGAATGALLNGPTDVALDELGQGLFVAEGDGGRVRRIDLNDGSISSVATFSEEKLFALVLDTTNRNLYVSSPNKHTVHRIALDGAGGQKPSRSCAAPAGIEHAAAAACIEGAEVLGSVCTPACEPGFLASEQRLSCRDGVLLPTTFTCSAGPCLAPMGLPNADWLEPCAEGRRIASGDNCTARCARGYVARQNLTCYAGTLTPARFECCFRTCETTTTSTTTLILQASGEKQTDPSTGDSNANSPPASDGLQVNVEPEGKTITPSQAPKPSTLVVHGSVAFNVAAYGLSTAEVSLLADTGAVMAPLQRALADVCKVQKSDVTVLAVAVHAVRRRLDESPARTLSAAMHRFSAAYTVRRAPAWMEEQAGALGSSRTTVGAAFVEALDREGLGAALKEASERRAEPCTAPTNIDGAPMVPCEEGFGSISSGSQCAARCLSPLIPSVKSLRCFAGLWSPPTFTCADQTPEQSEALSPCSTPAGIVGAASPPCQELGPEGPGVLTEWCTPSCANDSVPSEVVLACLQQAGGKATLRPRTFQCHNPYCNAPTDIQMAADNPCKEGPQIPLEGQCTTACRPGYSPTTELLTCVRGSFVPASFGCVDDAFRSGSWRNPRTTVSVAPPKRFTTTAAPDEDSSLNDDEGSDAPIGLVVSIVALTVFMVVAVFAVMAVVLMVMRRRALNAKAAKEWDDTMNHINLGVEDDLPALKDGPAQIAHAPLRESADHSHLGNSPSTDEDEDCSTQEESPAKLKDKEDIGDPTEDDKEDRQQKRSRKPGAKKEQTENWDPTAWSSTTPRSHTSETGNLDCVDLLRLAQKAADAMKSETLSARSTSSAGSARFDDILEAAQEGGALGRAECRSDLRHVTQRDAKFEALDDELAWSVQDDSRLTQLLEATPNSALGLRPEGALIVLSPGDHNSSQRGRGRGRKGRGRKRGSQSEEVMDEPPREEVACLVDQLIVRPARPTKPDAEANNAWGESTTITSRCENTEEENRDEEQDETNARTDNRTSAKAKKQRRSSGSRSGNSLQDFVQDASPTRHSGRSVRKLTPR